LSHRIDHAGAVDPGDERKDGPARALLAGAQAHVEHAVDGRGVHANADLARARLRVRNFLVAENLRRAVAVDDDRFHAAPVSRW
jgi:hypothetical protein